MRLYFLLLFCTLLGFPIFSQYDTGVLTSDGAWCWFSDPRAIMKDNTIFAAWVKSNGNVEAAKFDRITKDIQTDDLYFRLEQDDHDNPGLVFTENHKLLAMYTRHSKKDLFNNELVDFRRSFEFSGAQLIHPIGAEQLDQFPRESITYTNPIRLVSEDNRIYCFGRWTGFKPNIMWSDNEGKTWTKAKVFITNYPFDKGNRPYVKYYSDGQSRIHIIFTDGHPRNEPTNSVYYSYYENGAFFQAGGKQITTLDSMPFEPKEASIIYRSNEKDGRAWIADVGHDKSGNPVVLYTRSPTEQNHEYWYARYIDNKWINHKVLINILALFPGFIA